MEHKNQGFDNVLNLVGSTPLIKLNTITSQFNGDFYAKVEAFNPGHASKDRMALHIIEQAEKQGLLKPGDTIIETISDQSGFSIAMVGCIKGYNCILAVSSKCEVSKIDTLKAMGVTVYVCPEPKSVDYSKSCFEVAKRLHREIKGSIYINQYFNQLNSDAHYRSTGPEIWEQTTGKITHLVTCSGTGTTISGTAKFLKEQNPDIKILGVEAFCSVLKTFQDTKACDAVETDLHGVGGLSESFIPAVTDFDVVNYFSENDVIVVMFPDYSLRYLNKSYSDTWRNDQRFFDSVNKETIQKIQYIK
ncbi:PLP-dependent cysteine synthase family protein [Formosa algae]|uniref:Cystathionine beta-synthase n=1 Tax=Formosa algae TaxID=225843 RepID=A0A9X1C9C2_9FLAO|nr:cysteine synthase family protein [Formosa algae]MBP1840826.1 cystathionine beta-synthase [Formosa algae]MDQ0336277.1 cystathionine beta-synthase [Formosa algae]OEI80305.1 cystathionine beta-synthase [Formosa algae]PNW28772.1 cystathionine beta-synthase [Formosa algae]